MGGQTPMMVAVIGMATAKVSLGLFLLRIVLETWHKIAQWLASLSLLVISVLTAVIFWVQCLPPQFIFDPRVEGRCIIHVTPFSILLGSWCAAVDFFFAGFPWLFIWKLNMRYREKVTIAASMSLGVVAGICGVIRTVELSGLASANYTEDTVNLVIWSAAELAVTKVCAGVPVLRPLLRRGRTGVSQGSSNGYYKHGTGNDGPVHRSIKLSNLANPNTQRQSDIESNRGFPDAHPRLDIRDPTTVTDITRDNQSQEEILGPEYCLSYEAAGAIQIQERVDVRVEETVIGPSKKSGKSDAGF
ncbi:hypothetical protein B0H66DRAFT_602422 [Apodospora peruviana]|uniref:Rhodopsin domain-containing protein n=1 Tax=Apodospora peruviana TaxID=516989 RepID=A0AAE0M844_9PEZI|nr:hypothetical protein B0H66DRAFT_602422 [Apodospora peruviana]